MTVNGGKLTVNQPSGTDYGIFVGGALTIEGGEITVAAPANGSAHGLYVKNDFTIGSGASLTSAVTSSNKVTIQGTLTLNGGTEVTTDTVFTASMTVYGHWTLKTYTVSYNAG